MASDHRGPGFGTGVVLGGIIGALVGLVLAPRPGEDTLAQLKEKTAELKERAEELAAEARHRVHDVIEEGRVVAGRMRPAREGSANGDHSAEKVEDLAD